MTLIPPKSPAWRTLWIWQSECWGVKILSGTQAAKSDYLTNDTRQLLWSLSQSNFTMALNANLGGLRDGERFLYQQPIPDRFRCDRPSRCYSGNWPDFDNPRQSLPDAYSFKMTAVGKGDWNLDGFQDAFLHIEYSAHPASHRSAYILIVTKLREMDDLQIIGFYPPLREQAN